MSTLETPPSRSAPPKPPSDAAFTGVAFAACALLLIGVFQIVAGLTAVFENEFFVVSENYAFDVDVTAWGVIHLVIGTVMLATAAGLFAGRPWAAVAAIVMAGISAVANFFFVPYYPLWSLLVIAFDVWVIWSLTRPGVLDD